MLNLTLQFPKYRLKISLAKRRHLHPQKSYLQKIQGVFDIRRGSRVSRPFRNIFQHKRIKAVLGGNIALLTLVVSVYSPSVSALSTISQTDMTTLSPVTVELTTKQGVRVPLEEFKLTQGYSFFHPAVDLDALTGDPVYPIMRGKVESVVYDRFGLGKHIILAHGSGFKSIYAHLSKIEVGVGEEVDTEEEIGQVGSTGRSFGDHLHLELIDNDHHINPRTILPLK